MILKTKKAKLGIVETASPAPPPDVDEWAKSRPAAQRSKCSVCVLPKAANVDIERVLHLRDSGEAPNVTLQDLHDRLTTHYGYGKSLSRLRDHIRTCLKRKWSQG